MPSKAWETCEPTARQPGRALPYLVLLVDNFAPVFPMYPKLENFFIRLGREGGSYGICMVATCGTPPMALGLQAQPERQNLHCPANDRRLWSTIPLWGAPRAFILKIARPWLIPRRNASWNSRPALPTEPAEGTAQTLTAIHRLGGELIRRWGPRKTTVTTMPARIPIRQRPAEKGRVRPGLDGG